MLTYLCHLIAKFILTIVMGYQYQRSGKTELDVEKMPKKFVCIGEPHTSYIDFLYMILVTWFLKFPKYKFMMNKKYVRFPCSFLLRRMGVIEIDKTKESNTTEKLIKEINKSENFILLLSPSGTRKSTDHWKSGFYYIAKGSKIPILPIFIDGKTKTFGYGDFVYLTENLEKDMDYFRNFYKVGLNSSDSKIRLIQESHTK